MFARIIGRLLVQKIHKNINNLISSRLCTKLCWTDTKYKNLVLLAENAHSQKVPRTTIKVLRNSLYWYDTVEPPWLPPLARDLYKTLLPYPSSGSPTDPTSYWNSLGISLEPDWQIDNTFFDRPVMARTQILVYNQHHHLLRWWCNNFLFLLTSC